MKTKFLIFFVFCICFSVNIVQAQEGAAVYTDPTTTFALSMYSDALARSQNRTIEEQSRLKEAQIYIAGKLELVHKVQKKLYKGLREVSGTFQNAMQVKQIYEEIKTCHHYLKRIKKTVTHKPQYAIFGIKASEKTYEQVLKISTELTSLLTSSDTNLATAGDRYKILFEIQDEIQTLKIWLISLSMTLERAVRIGFLKSLNPFQGYIDTDKNIIKNLMYKWRTMECI